MQTMKTLLKMQEELETVKELMVAYKLESEGCKEKLQKVRKLVDNTVATFVTTYDLKEILGEKE